MPSISILRIGRVFGPSTVMHSASLLIDQKPTGIRWTVLFYVSSQLLEVVSIDLKWGAGSSRFTHTSQQLLHPAHIQCKWGITNPSCPGNLQTQTCEHVWWRNENRRNMFLRLQSFFFLFFFLVCRCCWHIHWGHCSSGSNRRGSRLANCSCSRTRLERNHLLSPQRSQLPFIKFQFMIYEY